MSLDRPSNLLRELAAESPPPERAADARARRERTVAHLRGLQARAAVRREMRSSWRNRLLVAAALLIPSAALGASWLPVPWTPFVRSALVESGPGPRPPEAPRPRRLAPQRPVNTTPSAAQESTEAPAATALASAAPAATRSASRLTPPARAGRAPGSTLAEENRLMQAALSAARDGQNGQAVRLLTELLARYPRSLLAQNAQVERFRALKRSGDDHGAARLALYYLNQYPNGMAADEARRLAAATGSFRDEHAL